MRGTLSIPGLEDQRKQIRINKSKTNTNHSARNRWSVQFSIFSIFVGRTSSFIPAIPGNSMGFDPFEGRIYRQNKCILLLWLLLCYNNCYNHYCDNHHYYEKQVYIMIITMIITIIIIMFIFGTRWTEGCTHFFRPNHRIGLAWLFCFDRPSGAYYARPWLLI